MRVLFFGRLRDAAGMAEMEAPAGIATIAALRQKIAETNSALAELLAAPSVRVAVDRVMTNEDADLRSATEIAFLPPLSGG